MDGRHKQPGGRAFDGVLKVLGEASVSVEPSEGSLDDPAPRQEFEAFGGIGSLDDFECPFADLVERGAQFFAGITAIKPKGDKVMRMAAQTPRIEAGNVFIPSEASWLSEYLHELAMFPKGKFDDQVDSTSQLLAHIGMPSDADNWMEYIRLDTLSRHGLRPEDITVTFDHIDPKGQFWTNDGRKIRREEDGFYHVSAREWEGFRAMQAVTLIEDESA